MGLLDTLVATFAPHECLGCGLEGRLLCNGCSKALQRIPQRCYRCKKLTSGNRTCSSCRSSSKLYVLQATSVYEGIAKDLVWQLKFHGAQAAAKEMGAQMATMIKDENITLVHIPTATGRVRQRGYDQAELLARALSSQTGLLHRPLLSRLGQHHQVGAKREQRVTQLAHAFRVTNANAVQDTHIILIDDVLTTGATMEAAAKTLKDAGAKRVDGLVFAQV